MDEFDLPYTMHLFFKQHNFKGFVKFDENHSITTLQNLSTMKPV